MQVTPTPTDEEMAAIAAAISQTVLRPVVVLAADDESSRPPAWRFSGRWWRRPIVTRRDRPVW